MVTLKCTKNDDGTYNASVFQDEEQVNPNNFTIHEADCDEIRDLHQRAVKAFATEGPVKIQGECTECFE